MFCSVSIFEICSYTYIYIYIYIHDFIVFSRTVRPPGPPREPWGAAGAPGGAPGEVKHAKTVTAFAVLSASVAKYAQWMCFGVTNTAHTEARDTSLWVCERREKRIRVRVYEYGIMYFVPSQDQVHSGTITTPGQFYCASPAGNLSQASDISRVHSESFNWAPRG